MGKWIWSIILALGAVVLIAAALSLMAYLFLYYGIALLMILAVAMLLGTIVALTKYIHSEIAK